MNDRHGTFEVKTNKPDVAKRELAAAKSAAKAFEDHREKIAYKYGLEKGRAEALHDALVLLATAMQNALTKGEA